MAALWGKHLDPLLVVCAGVAVGLDFSYRCRCSRFGIELQPQVPSEVFNVFFSLFAIVMTSPFTQTMRRWLVDIYMCCPHAGVWALVVPSVSRWFTLFDVKSPACS